MIEIISIQGIGEVSEGRDLAELLGHALTAIGIAPGRQDVLVVTQKIVSKSEGRAVLLDEVQVSDEVAELASAVRKDPRLVSLVLAESSDVVRAVPHVLITRHNAGHVMANAGIDQSNLGPDAEGRALLLPQDPDLSAQRLRDSMKRGEFGRCLQVTQVALADMVANAAGLATGEGAEGIPAALVGGLQWDAPDASSRALIRLAAEDLFR